MFRTVKYALISAFLISICLPTAANAVTVKGSVSDTSGGGRYCVWFTTMWYTRGKVHGNLKMDCNRLRFNETMREIRTRVILKANNSVRVATNSKTVRNTKVNEHRTTHWCRGSAVRSYIIEHDGILTFPDAPGSTGYGRRALTRGYPCGF